MLEDKTALIFVFNVLILPAAQPGDKCPSGCRVGVDGGDPSTAPKRTRLDRAARGGIVATGTNLGFLGICYLIRKPTNCQEHPMACWRGGDSHSSGAVAPRAFRGRRRAPPPTITVCIYRRISHKRSSPGTISAMS
ncbi:hypothetical protein Y032_0221g2548 [Ancylostoma ceylanicum]|uniref:Uncharacterized protein n=1 Tax=Ancylostoma ceylanicum TaxID=53326 RepID=A0A016SIU1_9BILA|nr:hypothetical protein Y032_0221g2548 [Ancylostoma ceylanicum]